MINYRLFEQTKFYNKSGYYTSYGIIVFDDEVHIRTVPDVSLDKSAVQKLVDKFNKYELDPCHLKQAIEDYLYDLCV